MKIAKITLFRLSILDRYLLRQLIIFCIFSVSLFASVGVTIGTVSELTYKINEYNLPINIDDLNGHISLSIVLICHKIADT